MEPSADKILTKLPQEIVIFIEELDVAENGAALDKQFPKLKSVLQSGFSQLLLHPDNAKDPKSSLFYFLSFENSFTNEEITKATPVPDKVRSFSEKPSGTTSNKASQDDDELTEVKYPDKPRTLKDLTTMSVSLWTNLNEIAELSELSGINYFYSSKGAADSSKLWNQIDGLLAVEHLDILLIHLSLKEEATKSSLLQSIDELVGLVEGKVFLKVILGPFGKSRYEQAAILQSHLGSIKDEGVLKDLQEVLPRQTYQFHRAEVNKELVDTPLKFLFSFSLNSEKKGSRIDKIESFEMLSQKESLRCFGGGKINIAGLFREITFELGKLPKFGA